MPTVHLGTGVATARIVLHNDGPDDFVFDAEGYFGSPDNGSGTTAAPLLVTHSGSVEFLLHLPLSGTLQPGTYDFLLDIYARLPGHPAPSYMTAGFVGSEPVTVIAAVPATPLGRLLGDVDGDGVLTDNDRLLIDQITVGGYGPWSDEQLWAADVLRNGINDSRRGLALRRHLHGDPVGHPAWPAYGWSVLPALRYPGPARLLGDVNGDGVIDMADVQTISNALLNRFEMTPEQAWAADVNQDGVVDLGDVQHLFRALQGLVTLPAIVYPG